MQFGDAVLYRWLLEIGLSPRKSLTLGAIDVPTEYLFPLVRGLLDGDGSILTYRHKGTGKARGAYDALRVRFCSASEAHVIWLRENLSHALGIHGWISRWQGRDRARPAFYLCFANRESSILLTRLYQEAEVPFLERKRQRWIDYSARHSSGRIA